jgi:hypothetical protein
MAVSEIRAIKIIQPERGCINKRVFIMDKTSHSGTLEILKPFIFYSEIFCHVSNCIAQGDQMTYFSLNCPSRMSSLLY